MTKYIAKQFKGTNLSEQAQYIANYEPFSHKYGGDSYYSFIHYSSFRNRVINATGFLNAPKIKEAGYPSYKLSKTERNNNIKLANKYYYQLINNNIKETTYFKRIVNIFFKDKNNYKNKNIGIYVYPKTSKYYGSFTVIIID